MPSASLLAASGAAPSIAFGLLSLLYVLVSVYVYISLIHQISARTPNPGEADAPARIFGLPEAILAAVLILFLLLNIGASISRPPNDFSASNLLGYFFLIVFAVAIAPVIEEFLFRFFLYNVIKRYFGRLLGVILSALLFAAAHAHFPSFVPLFVLGSCFAIAYEWSGSILVAMTMHSLFNSVTLTALAFPEIFSP